MLRTMKTEVRAARQAAARTVTGERRWAGEARAQDVTRALNQQLVMSREARGEEKGMR